MRVGLLFRGIDLTISEMVLVAREAEAKGSGPGYRSSSLATDVSYLLTSSETVWSAHPH